MLCLYQVGGSYGKKKIKNLKTIEKLYWHFLKNSENHHILADFAYRSPKIPQPNVKKINSNDQQPESGTLNSRKPIQGYKAFVGLADHGCGYPKDPGAEEFF